MIRVLLAVTLALAPAACGKRGNPVPPEGAVAPAPEPRSTPEDSVDPGLDADEVGG